MTRFVPFALAALLLLAFAGLAAADHHEVTLSGKIACGMCTLKLEGQSECQDVLVVEGDDGKPAYYYLAGNEVLDAFGHSCKGEKSATVVGTVTEKDGKQWINASRIEERKG